MVTVKDNTSEEDIDYLKARSKVLFELYVALKDDLRKAQYENDMKEKQISYMEYLLSEFKELKRVDNGFYDKLMDKLNSLGKR